jgi:hypothetical protein
MVFGFMGGVPRKYIEEGGPLGVFFGGPLGVFFGGTWGFLGELGAFWGNLGLFGGI